MVKVVKKWPNVVLRYEHCHTVDKGDEKLSKKLQNCEKCAKVITSLQQWQQNRKSSEMGEKKLYDDFTKNFSANHLKYSKCGLGTLSL